MFHGFDPATRDQVFVRRNKRAFLLALLGHALAIGIWAYRDRLREREVAVLLEPEIKDFAVDDEPEPEPEPEEEPPPPPPPDLPKPKPQAQKPKPKPRPEPPKVIPEGPPPEQAAPSADKNFGTGTSPGAGTAAKPKVEKKPEAPKPPPKPPPKVEEKIDPEKPVDRPEGATAPAPDPGNKAPGYPSELRDEGVEGEVVLKLHVYRDGSVKGAKILRVTTTATGDEARARAEKLLKSAVIAAIRTWKFTPSKYKGETITIWLMQTIPFKLTGGA